MIIFSINETVLLFIVWEYHNSPMKKICEHIHEIRFYGPQYFVSIVNKDWLLAILYKSCITRRLANVKTALF